MMKYMLNSFQFKLLICALGILAVAGAVIKRNVRIMHDSAEKLSQSQGKPFDGGSVRRALQEYVPK
jgi:hypothetical protein